MATKKDEKAQELDSAQPESRPETGFKDISDQIEQAKKDAQAPLELDADGNPAPRSSEAAIAVAQEQSYRAGAQTNGGGPWPPELLAQKFVGANRLQRPVPEYTSHEVKHA